VDVLLYTLKTKGGLIGWLFLEQQIHNGYCF